MAVLLTGFDCVIRGVLNNGHELPKNGAVNTVIRLCLCTHWDGAVIVRNIDNNISDSCANSSKQFRDCIDMCGSIAEQPILRNRFSRNELRLELCSVNK